MNNDFEIKVGNNITNIRNNMFSGCKKLTSVAIPEDVTSIARGGFNDTPWFKNYPDDFVIGGRGLIKYI